jgi:hypothetical protein
MKVETTVHRRLRGQAKVVKLLLSRIGQTPPNLPVVRGGIDFFASFQGD